MNTEILSFWYIPNMMYLSLSSNTLRVTQSAALESTTNTSNSNSFLGKSDKDFQFQHLNMKVAFIEASARGNKEGADYDIKAVEKWLAQVA